MLKNFHPEPPLPLPAALGVKVATDVGVVQPGRMRSTWRSVEPPYRRPDRQTGD